MTPIVRSMMEREMKKALDLVKTAMSMGSSNPLRSPEVGMLAHAVLSLSYVVETLLAEHSKDG